MAIIVCKRRHERWGLSGRFWMGRRRSEPIQVLVAAQLVALTAAFVRTSCISSHACVKPFRIYLLVPCGQG